jgi:Domain of unknown function (DUF4389)
MGVVTEHPVQLVVEDDLRRNRLTVFFRLILAIPHIIWVLLWTIAVVVAAFVGWIVALFTGRLPGGLHRFFCRYLRYQVHLSAYVSIAANPYPPFAGEEDTYPIDVRLPAQPHLQRRATILVRIVLALPALLVSAALGGSGGLRFPSRSRRSYSAGGGGALTLACSILAWFTSVVSGRTAKGLRDASAYAIGYSAQTGSYVLLVTDRYPNADPTAMLADVDRPPVHPVRLVGDPHDLRRSRATVFFRLLLAVPHIVWLLLWSVVLIVAAIANWFVTLFRGRPANSLHRFASAWIRYRLHVYAFLYLVANPFPGFVGDPSRYPLNVELPSPERQNRWKTGFRIVLAVPAIAVNSALGGALFATAVLTWLHALARGSATWGLRNLAAYALRYQSQLDAYILFVTDAYPHASPLEGAPTPRHEFAEAA